MRPDVSIIVATYDRPQWLEVELYSILAAAAAVSERVQVLVVDDASPTAAARDIASRLGVDYLRREQNGGGAACFATGFEASDGRFTSWWCDDDYMLPTWFGAHLAAIREADVVSSSFWLTDAELRPTSFRRLEPVTFAALRENVVSANDGSLCRREVVEGHLRPERRRAMLLTLWLALAAEGRRFVTIPDATWLYRRHPAQLSQSDDPTFAVLRAEAIAEYAVPA